MLSLGPSLTSLAIPLGNGDDHFWVYEETRENAGELTTSVVT